MSENALTVIEILNETLREIEEYADCEENGPVIEKLKEEFRRMISDLELARKHQSENQRGAFVP